MMDTKAVDGIVLRVASEQGPDEEIGCPSGDLPRYELFNDGGSVFADHDPFLEELNEDSRSLLQGAAGVIIERRQYQEDVVHYFHSAFSLEGAWTGIRAAFA